METKGIAKAMFDVISKINNFEGWKLDILIFGKSTYEIEETVCELHKLLSSQITVTVYRGKNVNLAETNSAIVFTKSSKELEEFNDLQIFSIRQRKNLNIFVYCDEIEKEIETISTVNFYTVSAAMFEFIFLNVKKFHLIRLLTLSWFSDESCNKVKMEQLNDYVIPAQKWNKELKIYPRFSNFHSCKLSIGLRSRITQYFHYIRKFGNEIEHFGIIPMLIEVLSKSTNFTYSFEIYSYSGTEEKVRIHDDPLDIIIMQRQSLALKSLNNIPVIDTSCVVFVIPPGDLYTIYEKLFLPFDRTTWILLSLTFLIAILVIFILKFVSKDLKIHFYGINVQAPALNVLSIFFGISLTRFPIGNLPRLIVALFVLFCLVFQTCYQSKLFEFMTSEMRKAEVQTMNELIEKEFKIYSPISYKKSFAELSYWPSSRVRYLSYSEMNINQLYSKISTTNERFVIIALKDTARAVELINNVKFKILNEPLITNGVILVSLHNNNFISEIFYETLRRLIPSGIPYHFIHSHREMFYKISKEFENKEPQVLSLTDLDFGFFIWLPFVGVSIVVFLLELIFKPKKKKIVKIKFAKVHPLSQNETFCQNNNQVIKSLKVSEDNLKEQLDQRSRIKFYENLE